MVLPHRQELAGPWRALVRDHHDMFEFQRWLQWIADEQVAARAAGRQGTPAWRSA